MRQVNVLVDRLEILGEQRHKWRYIGYDECNYTHTPEGEELLSKFGNLADAPYYVRTHHLLCNGNCHGEYKWGSTNAYVEDENGNVTYDFTVIDSINDILKKHNAIPFFELGFMPMQLSDTGYLASPTKELSFKEYKDTGYALPPKDYKKWRDLIYFTVMHCVERYGKEYVQKWYWELWNEPDIMYWRGTMEDFFKLYDYTEEAVHAALPEARLGGPATCGPAQGARSAEFLEKFLSHCAKGANYVTGKTGTRLDFITFHAKGGWVPFKLRTEKVTPCMKDMMSQVKLGLEIVKNNGYGDKEIVLSEADPDGWAAGGMYDNINLSFRNTEYYASYIAASYVHIEKTAKSLNMDVRPLAWAFLFVAERCFEGTRTFTTQGIEKASFNLFKMFAQMGKIEIKMTSSGERDMLTANDDSTDTLTDVSGFASKDEDGNIQAIIFSHHDDWDIKEGTKIKIDFTNLLPASQYEMLHYKIDSVHSNPYAQWIEEGRPLYPKGEQYNRIREKGNLELVDFIDSVIADDKGTLSYNMTVNNHSVSLIKLVGHTPIG